MHNEGPAGGRESYINVCPTYVLVHEAKSHFTPSLPRLHRPWWDTVEDMLLNTLIALGKEVTRPFSPFVQVIRFKVHRSARGDYSY